MRRWHEDATAMNRQKKIWWKIKRNVEWSAKENSMNGKTIGSLGRFRKKHAMDCGKSECFICHSDKLLKIKSKQQEIADLKLKEELNE